MEQNFRNLNLEKAECPAITIGKALEQEDVLFVDVRTPKEYEEAHIKDAISIPLMSDYQRHIIGTIYKQKSSESAIKKGWDFFEPIVNKFIEQFREIKDKNIVICCWRGGMRSRIVVNLLKLFGIRTIQLEGGFKSYMNDVVWKGLENFEKSYKPKFMVLFGNTGTRKTEILHKLIKKKIPVIDFEGLAQHRASVYGGVNLEPRTQKMFSILLYHELDNLKNKRCIIVEGESNKIGNVFLPKFISRKIENEIKVNVKADIKTRVAVIRKEYFSNKESIRQLYAITGALTRRIGKKKVEMLRNWLETKEYDQFTEYLLINYYDKNYIHNKMGYDYDLEVNSDDIDKTIEKIKNFFCKF